MPDVRPDPKPISEGGIGRKKPDRGNRRRGRIIATAHEWGPIIEAKAGPCRSCSWPLGFLQGIVIEYHHLVSRAKGGDDVADNIVPLCTVCNEEVTRNNPPYLHALAQSLTDAEYAYVVGKLGEGGPERLFGVSR